jgi:phage N-6-adenine-methyltransferase
MVSKSLFTSSSDEWATPQDFFDKLDGVYEFVFDLACSKENCKTRDGFTVEDNSLDQNWALITVETNGGWLWLNPPYSLIGEFVDKAWFEMTLGARIVMLIPARTDTKYFHNFIYKKPGVSIEFIKGRLKFGGSKNSAPFPSMLVVFNKDS